MNADARWKSAKRLVSNKKWVNSVSSVRSSNNSVETFLWLSQIIESRGKRDEKKF